jgi:transcriptional regulator of arginine metabolism
VSPTVDRPSADRLRALAERTPAIYPELKTDLEESAS